MPKRLLTAAVSAAFVSGCGSMVKEKPTHSTSASSNTGYLASASGTSISTVSGHCMRAGSWSEERMNDSCEGIEREVVEVPSKPETQMVESPRPQPVTGSVQEGDTATVEPDQQPTIETVVLSSRALFAHDASKLSTRGNIAMENLVLKLGEYTKIEKIEIIGYTDSVGTEAYNLELSERRANTIKDFVDLVYSDVDLKVQGLGETDPVSSNQTAEGRQQNRRVEIRVTAKWVKTSTSTV